MNELKVGFLTLLAIASMVVVTLKITSNKATFGEFIEYKTIISDATGIYENSSIKVAGIVAGKIKTIQLSGSQALVTFEVLKEIKITSFSKLRIKSVGFLGDKFIDIFLGDPSAPRLPAGSMIQAQDGAGFEQLGKDASDILKDVKVITKAIKESMYTDDQKNVIKSILTDIQEFSKNANDVSLSLKKIINGNEGKLNQSIENLRQMTEQLAYETDRYQDGSFMNDLDRVGPILEKVDAAMADLEEIVADVKSGKGTVGKLLRDEEVVDSVSQTLSGLNRIVGRVNRFKTNIEIYSGVNNIEGSKTEVNLNLMPSPERFFRFGIVVGDGSALKRITTTTTENQTTNSTSVLKETEVDESSFRFNFQIGRRFNRYALRAGLIENTGGLGFDYMIPENGFIARLEGYDYREDIGMNLRLTTEFRLWNILYAKAMAEDLARASEFHVYTFSAGLSFTDEDLSSLLWLAF